MPNDGAKDLPLASHGVIYFGNDWFAENRTSSHHIAQRLAARAPVLWIDSPGLRAPNTSSRDLRRLWKKLRTATRLPQEVRPGFWHCSVPQLPFRRFPGVAALNHAFGLWAVRRALRHVGFRQLISWFIAPHQGYMARRLGESLCVYYCTDDHSAHPGVDVEAVRKMELDLTRIADVVFVAPPALLAAKQAENRNVFFAPHGVDVALFSKAMAEETPVPALARELPRPVIGFFGSIAAWIDLDLIAHLARSRPNWSFLMVGHAFVDVAQLSSLPNVRLVGAQKYETLPQWAKAFDVAIIPYKKNRQVLNANPLKLREYLATGRPIVTVSNPEIERFREWVRIADEPDAFLAAVEASLLPEGEDAAKSRLAVVQGMTWDARAGDVLSKVEEALERVQHDRAESLRSARA